MKKPEIWVDGTFVEYDRATVHVLSHSLQRGSTVFESLSCEETPDGPAIFRLEAHLDRFLESARLTRMDVPFSRDRLVEAAVETVCRSGYTRCCIRPLAYYVGEELGILPEQSAVQVIIAVAPPFDMPDTFCAKISTVRKLSPETAPVAAKVAANYLSAMLAKLEAADEGFDEAILIDSTGNVAEAPTESLFIVKDGVIRTAPLGIVLAGITRDSVMQIARDLGYPVREAGISVAELYGADEVFMTGTSIGVVPIIQIGDQRIGTGRAGEVTCALRQGYHDASRGKNVRYRHWLTYVPAASE